jgi:hypothetical protein
MDSKKASVTGRDGFVPAKSVLLRPYGDEAVPAPFLNPPGWRGGFQNLAPPNQREIEKGRSTWQLFRIAEEAGPNLLLPRTERRIECEGSIHMNMLSH